MSQTQQLLGLASPPIGIAFLDQAPVGVRQWDGSAAPAGCAFWRQAMSGKTFYTVPSDHYNCAVGSYTHGVSLPEERAAELEQTVGFMVSSGYIKMDEVPSIPARKSAPAAVAYGPVDGLPFDPDVVVVAAPPGTAMMLYEAAVRSGAVDMLASVLGRPGCAGLPLTGQTGKAALSFGCKGNRIFTGLPDSDLYFFVPGPAWPGVEEKLGEILSANAAMAAHYDGKKEQFPIL
jgi:uncharacterized protein (DUF169 family)